MSKAILVCLCVTASALGARMFGAGDTNGDGCVDLKDYSQVQLAMAGPCAPESVVFWKSTVSAGAVTTLRNPRAGEGLAFFVTDIWTTVAGLDITLPAVLQSSSARHERFLRDLQGAYHFDTPIPVLTSIEVISHRSGIPTASVVLVGRYDAAPQIVDMN